MKNIYILIAFCVIFVFSASAQNHQWGWAKSASQPNSSTSSASTMAVATDEQGNVLVAGYYWSDSITFGSFTLRNTDHSGNSNDIYLVKYDATGTVLWAVTAGGPWRDYVNAVKTDKKGNVYIAGAFYSDSALFGGQRLYNKGPVDTLDDIYVAKYSASGAALWAKSFGGDYYDGAEGLATDASGDVYIGGFYRSDSISFGPYTFHDATGRQRDNTFLVKCDSMGAVVWAATATSTDYTEIKAVCTDPSGNVFVTGRFDAASATFGAQTIQNQTVGWNDVFLVKYDPSGTVLWAQDAGGSLSDVAFGVAADAHGNSYITGYYTSTSAFFGAFELDNSTTNQASDIFVAKYDPNGIALWANSMGGTQNESGSAIAVDSGNVYVTGYYYSPVLALGTGDSIVNSSSAGTTDDVFLTAYSESGSLVSAIDAGGLSYDYGNGIAVDHMDNVYAGGVFASDDIVFGNTTLNNITSTHNNNPFVVKYASVPTGISTLKSIPAIRLYPNPANSMITARSDAFKAGDVSVLIYDIAGEVIPLPYSISADQIRFNIADLAAGIYVIRFTAGGLESRARFIKI